MTASVRAFGHFPVSIGTSLALEGLYALERPVGPSESTFNDQQRQRMLENNKRHLRNGRHIDAVWVNLETLVRNVMEAYARGDNPTVTQYVNDVFEDIDFLQRTVNEQSNHTHTLVIYLEDADERKWVFPQAQWRKPSTKLQLEKQYQLDMILRIVVSTLQGDNQPLRIVKRFPRQSGSQATLQQTVVLMTHLPHQLFWSRDFKHLLLLESHTGMLKDRSQWSSKLKGVSGKDGIPFNPFTLQVLGDNHLFAGESRVVQRELRALADKLHWTAITGRERMVSDLRSKGGVILQEVYNKTMTAL